MALWEGFDSFIKFWTTALIVGLVLLKNLCVPMENTIVYMDGKDCDVDYTISGAVVYSHYKTNSHSVYRDSIDCRLTFKAYKEGWRLMLRFEDLDIPDFSLKQLCNDALYVYDDVNIFGKSFKATGNAGGLCGSQIPEVIYSSGSYLTFYFRTDSSGSSAPKGRGFHFVLTAFTDADEEPCAASELRCLSSTMCIDSGLRCDGVSHCKDKTDELIGVNQTCQEQSQSTGFWKDLLSLGIVASVAIVLGSLAVVIACVCCFIYCCCRYARKKTPPTDQQTKGFTPAAQRSTVSSTAGTTQIISATSPYPSSHQHSYQPMVPCHMATQYITYSPQIGPVTETYTVPQSAYSSSQGYAPNNYYRTFTPTSSRSAYSHNSADSNVKYSSNSDKVMLPVHL